MSNSGTHETAKKTQDTGRQAQGAESDLSPGFDASLPGTAHAARRARVDPRSLTPANVLYLQRAIGNRATAALLGRSTPPAQETSQAAPPNTDASEAQSARPITPTHSTGEPLVQRFPNTVFDDDVDWEKETVSVKKSEEGVSGGVYFFKGTAPVTTVVVKPEYGAPADSAQFADTFLKTMGINAPDSRLIAPDSAEGTKVLHAAASFGAPIPSRVEDYADTDEYGKVVKQYYKDLLYIKVMSAAEGTSVAGSARKVQSMGDVNTLIARLEQGKLLFDVGRLIVVDAFMNNLDRISVMKMNLGNIMYAGENITAIDSEAVLKKLNSSQIRERDFTTIENLFDPAFKDKLVQQFIDGIALIMYNEEEKQDPYTIHESSEHFKAYYNFDKWRGAIRAGIDAGISLLLKTLSSKKARSGLKESARDWESRGGQHVSWDTIRTRQKYMKARQSGKSQQDAIAAAKEYAEYREKRAGRSKGLKWTAKVGYEFKKRFGK